MGRGLLEPSLARFENRFYLTIRAEDRRGYVAVSDDGLRYGPQWPWAWDDGTPLEMSATQQHWLVHSDGLFLVYTRKDPSNEKIIRWRAPSWVAQAQSPGMTALPVRGKSPPWPASTLTIGRKAEIFDRRQSSRSAPADVFHSLPPPMEPVSSPGSLWQGIASDRDHLAISEVSGPFGRPDWPGRLYF